MELKDPIIELLHGNVVLQTLLDSLTDLVFVKDARGRYVVVNRAHARFLGESSAAKVVGKSSFDFFPAELAARYYADDMRVIETGREIIDEYEPSVDRNGKSRTIKRTKRPLRDCHGKIIGLIGIAQDVTEALQAEESLRLMHETLEQQVADRTAAAEQRAQELSFQKFALDQSAIVAATDARGRITYVNEKFCQISGYSREELIGQDHRKINSGLHPKEFFKEMYGSIAAGKVWRGEIRNRAKNGSYYWVDTTIVPIVDERRGGLIKGYVAIRQDITQHKEAEQALQQRTIELEAAIDSAERMQEHLQAAKDAAESASQAKGEFLANMSHEIRTPMTAIIGYADLLADTDRPTAERQEFVQTIRRNGEHLLSLINDLLDLSKVEAGKLCIEAVSCDPRQMMTEIESCMCMWARAKGIEFSVECDRTVPLVIYSDPTRLRQVLFNLVNNAIKFTQKGRVSIRITCDSGQQILRFDIADTGIGLSHEQQQVIFKPFAQADNSTTRRFGGTGLGLALSKRLVEMLGGDLTLVSEPGRGSTFSITLRNHAPDQSLAAKDQPAPRGAGHGASAGNDIVAGQIRGRLLLVEDGADNRRLVTIYLEGAGLTVECAENGQDAIEMVMSAERSEPYDVILMDMQMPVMDGYQATAGLRRRGVKKIPIIAFTAHALEGERAKCLAAGCDDYSTKPVDPDALIRTIARQLRRAAAEQEESVSKPSIPAENHEPAALPSPQSTADFTVTGKLRSRYHNDAAVRQVLPAYVEGLPREVSALSALLAAGRLDDLRRVVHQLKGSGGGYGFPDITRLAADAEAAIDARDDIEKVAASVNDLSAMIRLVEGYEAASEESEMRVEMGRLPAPSAVAAQRAA